MRFLGLACCLTLLSYGIALVAGSPLLLPFLRPVLRTSDPEVRARRLFALRLLPVALGIFVAFGLVLPAFLWLEPRSINERVGPWLIALAGLAASILAIGIVRCGLDLLATRRLIQRWSRTARPIRLPGITLPAFALDEPFPLVTVAGCVRLRLFVSSTVLERCTSAELAAIIAHESAHLRRGDPWKRLLLRGCPDLLALTPLASRIERRWAEATEQAADDRASAAGTSRSLDLASALVKVARLAGVTRPHELPLTALYRGDGLGGRVARLIERESAPVVVAGSRRVALSSIALAAVVLFLPAAAYLGVLHRVHQVLEAVVLNLG
jgi:hypothetical protein